MAPAHFWIWLVQHNSLPLYSSYDKWKDFMFMVGWFPLFFCSLSSFQEHLAFFLYHNSEPHWSEVRSPYDSICIFLRITGVELLFLDLWSIRLSAFEKDLFIFQSCLEFGYFLFYHCTSELLTHSRLINQLSSIKLAKFFCHDIIGWLITLCIMSFTEKNFLI